MLLSRKRASGKNFVFKRRLDQKVEDGGLDEVGKEQGKALLHRTKEKANR